MRSNPSSAGSTLTSFGVRFTVAFQSHAGSDIHSPKYPSDGLPKRPMRAGMEQEMVVATGIARWFMQMN